MSDTTDAGPQRLDKWLWHARFARTRTGASRLVEAGHVRVNTKRAETGARLVRDGDVLTVALGREVRVVRVRGVASRRGSAPDAKGLYDDLTERNPGQDAPAARLAPPLQSG